MFGGEINRQNRPQGHEALSLRAEGMNNEGRVALRSVLYLLYHKYDQMIDRVVIIRKTVFIYKDSPYDTLRSWGLPC